MDATTSVQVDSGGADGDLQEARQSSAEQLPAAGASAEKEGTAAAGQETHSAGCSVEQLDPKSLIMDSTIQSRVRMDPDTVREYAEAMREGAEFPPVDVFRCPGGETLVADGFHRVTAAIEAGLGQINANVRPGSRGDALRSALKANCTHGMRRTREDVKKAIRLAYEQREWLGLPEVPSARVVADLVGCDHKTVTAELGKFPSWSAASTRTGADGKTRSKPQKSPSNADTPEQTPAGGLSLQQAEGDGGLAAPSPEVASVAGDGPRERGAETATEDNPLAALFPTTSGTATVPAGAQVAADAPTGQGAPTAQVATASTAVSVATDSGSPTATDMVNLFLEALVSYPEAYPREVVETAMAEIARQYPQFLGTVQNAIDAALAKLPPQPAEDAAPGAQPIAGTTAVSQ